MLSDLNKGRLLCGALALLLSSCCTDEKCRSKDVDLATSDVDLSSDANDPANMNFIATAGNRVFFDFDRQELSAESRDTLDRQADWLMKSPHKVTVEGYCDDRGTSEYNIGLGNRRANSVKDYLISKGVPAGYIETISYGKDKPIEVVGSLSEVRRQNRVAVTVINESVKYNNESVDELSD